MQDINEHGRIVSRIPGRLRLHVHHPKSCPELIRNIRTCLEDRPGIQHIKTNHSTGSVTIHYDTQAYSSESLIAILYNIGVIQQDTFNTQTTAGVPETTGHSTTAVQISEAIRDLDHRVFQLRVH